MCVQYTGDIMSTSGDVHYIEVIPRVHKADIMNTSVSTSGGYHEYIGGIS